MPKVVGDVEIYELDEIALLLLCAKSTILRYIRDGKLKATKIGRRLVVSRESLNSFVLGKNEREFRLNETISFPNLSHIYHTNQPCNEEPLSLPVVSQDDNI